MPTIRVEAEGHARILKVTASGATVSTSMRDDIAKVSDNDRIFAQERGLHNRLTNDEDCKI